MKIDFGTLNKTQQDQFINGWEEAGGYMGDLVEGNPTPSCAPWTYEWGRETEVEGATPEEWGAYWWNKNKDEIMELLEIEARMLRLEADLV